MSAVRDVGAPSGIAHRLVERLATVTAVVGGLVLTALVVLICVSILGRSGNSLLHADWLTALVPGVSARLLAAGVGPVHGDYELVEAGIAFAIFAFLPICQLRGGHARVDVFTNRLPARLQRAIAAFWETCLAAAIVLITVQLYAGLHGKLGNGQTTYLLQFPLWWAYAASFSGAVVASAVALYCAGVRLAAAFGPGEVAGDTGDTGEPARA